MRRHRIGYGAIVAGTLILYIIANRGEMLLLLAGLLLLPLVFLGVQVLAMRSFSLTCTMRETCLIGQDVPLRMKLKRKSRLPLGAVAVPVDMENILYQEKQAQTVVLQPSEKRSMEFSCLLRMEDCGTVRTTVSEARCFDLLGLFCWKKKVHVLLETMVYPAQLQLQVQLARRPETTITGELYDQNRKGQDVSEVAVLREYQAGDSLGSIHWKLSAKLDSLIVREFGYPSNYSVLVLYDMMKYADGTPVPNAYNDAVLAFTVAVSRGMMELHLEHSVGRIYESEYQELPVYSVNTWEDMVLNLLCRPIAERENARDVVFYFLQNSLKRSYTKLIFITPNCDDSLVRQLSKELDLTVIQVGDGGESTYVDASGYSVISADAKHCEEKIHTIVI